MLKRFFLAVLVVTGLGLVPAAPVQASPAPIDLVGLDFNFINVNSRKCLTVTGGGAGLVQRGCETTTPYRWRFAPATMSGLMNVVQVGSGKCLTFDRPADSAPAVLGSCDDSASRRWRLLDSAEDSTAQVQNADTGKCLTIAGGGTADNDQAVQYACDDKRSRRWTVRLLSIPFIGQPLGSPARIAR